MTTTFWTGASQNTAQVDTLTVTAVATGGVLTATMGIAPYTVSISYTCLSTDTTTTAAAALQALLANTAVTPPQFQEASYSATTTVITVTAVTPGTPFTLAASATGGAAMTHAVTTANVSQSDVANPQNYNRNGFALLPQSGDDVVLADSTIPLLWNLKALATIPLNSFFRWQSFNGTVGLPENNPSGYVEYRPTYLQLDSSVAVFPVVLGQGQTGTGPSRERYDFQNNPYTVNVLAAGSPADDYSIRILGTGLTGFSNTLNIQGGVSVGVAMLPGEAAVLSTILVDSGSLALGPGVTFTGSLPSSSAGSAKSSPGPSQTPTGTLTVITGSATIFTNPGTISLQNGASLVVQGLSLTYPSLIANGGSTITWVTNGTIQNLVLQASSTFDKSQDVRPMLITAATIDGDTCQILDPYNAISYGGRITVNNAISSGPFQLGTGRQVQIF